MSKAPTPMYLPRASHHEHDILAEDGAVVKLVECLAGAKESVELGVWRQVESGEQYDDMASLNV